ncbi:MAG: hemin uptake protein HemP [Gammaproteobacteria bacterium]|nr:hemin uptake protein HemP [Gammaproteobacteria bacterium]MBU1656404.1 hemin uptake protein HemP [Gammaproteobacteria bacterium]MBU1960952.1 hemin uptake protein HemP [Gammaproteobacteria bacterium]
MNPDPKTFSNEPAGKRLPAETSPTRRLSSEELFRGNSRLIISHGGFDYCLLVTRNGKLILTK